MRTGFSTLGGELRVENPTELILARQKNTFGFSPLTLLRVKGACGPYLGLGINIVRRSWILTACIKFKVHTMNLNKLDHGNNIVIAKKIFAIPYKTSTNRDPNDSA